MTEAEWLACDDPLSMLDILTGQCDNRKWRLFAVESCRPVLNDFYYPALEVAVDFGRDIAEGFDKADWNAYDQIREDVEWGLGEMCEILNHLAEAVEVAILPHLLTVDHGRRVVRAISAAYHVGVVDLKGDEQFSHQAALLREIFGNPFSAPFFKSGWRTSDVMPLARGIYEEKAFDRMPILADALQDAGCDSEDILSHCRDPHATHVRGCWALDLVLGLS